MNTNKENENLSRKEIRRRRRIRNQVLAYLTLITVAIILIIGISYGGKIATDYFVNKQAEESIAEEVMTEVIETEPVETTVEETEDNLLDELVNSYIAEMTIEEKIAGLFVVTPESITDVQTVVQAGDGTKEALEKYPVGGIIYFDKNIESAEQLKEMITNTIEFSKNPIFIAVDEEGGEVARLGNSEIGVDKTPTMEEIGANGDASFAQKAGTTIGSYLAEYGFNVNFAPVGDVLTNPDSPLESRSFSGDPVVASEMVSSFVTAIQDTGVSSCVKHFPGIGDTSIDTHDAGTSIEVELDVMKTREFLPFAAGIDAGSDFIMAGHVVAKAIDPELPSSLSPKVITDILRIELGYEGIIITDALEMKAITEQYKSDQVAIMAINAGVDMILMPEDFNMAYESLLNAVAEGTITEERINESLRRIYRVKLKENLE